MVATHVVQDLEFEVGFESEEQAFDLQDRVSAFARGPALRILAEVFDQGSDEADLQLDRLEVDLGVVEAGELEQQWADRLREQLHQALAELTAAPESPSLHRRTAQQAELETLLHYVRRGLWPWHAPAATDAAALAQRVWRHDATALLARLREWPDPHTAARRLARHFPAEWCEQLVRAMGGDTAPANERAAGPAAPAVPIERRLLRALQAPAAPAEVDHGPADPARRAARRRLRALLADDAPELPEDDLGELMQLWRLLQHEDPQGLREDLQSLGRRVQVRRRIAQRWPEVLLRQLPRLWLGEDEGRRVVAALQHGLADTGAGGRRQRWEALLRLLWAGADDERIDATSLERDLRGHGGSQPASAPQPSPEASPSPAPTPWGTLLSGSSDPAAGRLALREAVSSAERRRRLAAALTATELARTLALWWPVHEAESLAALAFAPLPPTWHRDGESIRHTELLVLCALRALHETADADWTAHGLAARWCRALAVPLGRSPVELRHDLHEPGARGTDAALCDAWARWLPRPAPVPAPALADALQRGEPGAWQRGWAALLDQGVPVAREALRQLGDSASARAGLARQLTDAQWLQLLEAFLPPGPARAVLRMQQALRRALGDAPDPAARETMLREWTLAVLFWHPGAGADEVAAHLMAQGARREGLATGALALRLAPEDRDLFPTAGADMAALDLSARGRPSAADAGSPRLRADADAVGRVVASLRGAGPAPHLAADELKLLLALADDGPGPAREAIVRALESAPAARALAHALAPDELLRLVAWLRPLDADALREAWPRLQALVPGPGGGEGASAWPKVARTVLRELFEEDRPLAPAALRQRAALAVKGTPGPQRSPWILAPADEPVFVANAGVVLLAPYLPRLFGLLGLAGDRAFADADAAERAVAVTQYAVTGVSAAAETQLPLNKLLCGLGLHTPVPSDVQLERAEREAVDGMLQAVIGHWKALGQTSLAGLRQTFLQREGRLEHKEDAWHLQVPSQTFDMLIDRLPWGFSTIRYPWMPEVLHVQWR